MISTNTIDCKPYLRQLVYHGRKFKGNYSMPVKDSENWMDYQNEVNAIMQDGFYCLACSVPHPNELLECRPYLKQLVWYFKECQGTFNLNVPEDNEWLKYQAMYNASSKGLYYLACSLPQSQLQDITVYHGFHLGDPRPINP